MSSTAIKPYPIELITAQAPMDQTLAKALLASANEYSDHLRGRRIWLACSGGRDSLAMAALCSQLYQQGKLGFLPQLLHVDHNLQVDSSLWATHVAKWAQAQQLSCTILQAHIKGADEQAARKARYQLMLGFINQGDVLLLAHHGDDQAETMLMRLMQGAGVKGLAAMQPWREQTQGARHNVLWRPWLAVRRNTISRYAKRLQLPYIDDPTNEDGDNVRSRLRRDIMPLLASYNSNVIENMARSAQLLSDAATIVEAQARQDWQQTDMESLNLIPDQRVLAIDKLTVLPLYRQRQLLHFWLAQDEPLPPNKQLIDEVIALIQRHDNDHQTQLEWYAQNQRYSIRRYREQLYRLSQSWLDWLSVAPAEQTQLVSRDQDTITINLLKESRIADKRYSWQLSLSLSELASNELASNELASLPLTNQNQLIIKVTALTRQQKLKTQRSGQAQSSKKLYQTLGVPIWLRKSLAVISVIMTDSKTTIELPLFLVSPFNSWKLDTDSGFNTQKADLKTMLNNRLYLND